MALCQRYLHLGRMASAPIILRIFVAKNLFFIVFVVNKDLCKSVTSVKSVFFFFRYLSGSVFLRKVNESIGKL